MIKPFGNRVLVQLEKEKDIIDTGSFKVMRTKKETLMRGTLIDISREFQSSLTLRVGDIIYFSAYGSEEVDGKVLINASEIWAYERTATSSEPNIGKSIFPGTITAVGEVDHRA